MRIGVIGMGYVGQAVARAIGSHHDLVTWDISDGTAYPADRLATCDFAMISVPTPPGADGAADISAVVDAVTTVPCERILLKSTVPPGTTDRLREAVGKQICFWPEYIGESAYYNPFFPTAIEEVPFVIVGGRPEDRGWFVDALLSIFGPTKRYLQCTAIEAELAKYAENAFIAAKITFVNEFRRICEEFGADWHTVREAWLLDPRVDPMHTAAFGANRGFGGKCLPKDLRAIVAAAQEQGYDPELLRQVLRSNDAFRAAGLHTSEADAEV